jgi:hypothetical protein
MRPNAVESLRGLQAALMQNILPELQTLFAQDVAQVSQMLIESLVAEWDSAADHLYRDNEVLTDLLRRAQQALGPVAESNEDVSAIVHNIGEVLALPPEGSLAISRLTERNNALRAVLERTLEVIEDLVCQPGAGPLLDLRRDIYNHLRKVAVRGWSVFDLLSFREKMAQVRASLELT